MINNKSFDLERVYTENREKFIGFALGYSVSKDTAIDIYQDAVVALMEQIKKNKPIAVKSSVATYLFAIGKYMLFHHLKKKKNQPLK
ncbi:sigma factor [Sediminibacterium salmoneum]|uniref:sigma factor n=1 Tax=Sediminibacterium salmoneum TaxID=426421 RepID=UPI00047B0570|nr:sigma factor [Sediminibacterium salmoneum]